DGGKATQIINLEKGEQGTWQTEVKHDLGNKYYTFQVCDSGKWLQERPDIYAKALGVNGKRGMVGDLASNNPNVWARDKKLAQKNFTDIVIYELHVRDLSISPQSGIKNKGKFLGLTET